MLNPRQTGPGQRFTAGLFQPEHSVSTGSTPELTSGADRSWEKTAREAAQIPQLLQPRCPSPEPSLPPTQPCAGSGTNTTGKGMRPWAAWERNCRCLCRRHTGLLIASPHLPQRSAPLMQDTHAKQWSLTEPDLRTSTSTAGEQALPATGQRQ